MSQLWTPQQAQQQQIAIGLNVLPDTSISIQINGLIVPPLPAEQIVSLGGSMIEAGKKAIASRVPVEANNGPILQVVGQGQIVG